jgi:hypothetical protein
MTPGDSVAKRSDTISFTVFRQGHMALSDERLLDIVRELATKPGHDKVKASIQELLVDGLGAERSFVHFEKRVPEAQGRIDAIVGRTAFEVKSDLAREFGDAEEQLTRYLPERERATKSRFIGIATDGLEWRAYEWRNAELVELRSFRSITGSPKPSSPGSTAPPLSARSFRPIR